MLIPGLFGSAYGFRTLVPLLTAAGYRTIVIEPLGIGSSARPEKANYSLTAQTDRIAAVLDSLHVRDALLIDSSGDSSWVTDAVVAGYTAGAARNLDATLKAYIAMANAREPIRLAPHLAEVPCPVRLVVGGARHDGDVGSGEVQLLERLLRTFALDSVPGAGHFIYEEQPGAVMAAVARLKASVTAPHAAGSE